MIRAYNAKQWEVQAVLDGRKSCIRIAVKYKYSNTEMKIKSDKRGSRLIEIQKDVEGETYGKNPDGSTWHRLLPYIEKIPLYKKGDILYVRETWYKGLERYLYRADYSDTEKFYRDGKEIEMKWHPSIHMPKEAARIFLKVTDVRLERLQDITIADIRNEGLSSAAVHAGDMEIAIEEWKILWNSTVKKSDLDCCGWDANPWVWVIEFERCEKPEGV